MKKMFKLLIGCFVLIVFLVLLLACILFFFWRQIWERVAPFFGMGQSVNYSNTYLGEQKIKLPVLPEL